MRASLSPIYVQGGTGQVPLAGATWPWRLADYTHVTGARQHSLRRMWASPWAPLPCCSSGALPEQLPVIDPDPHPGWRSWAGVLAQGGIQEDRIDAHLAQDEVEDKDDLLADGQHQGAQCCDIDLQGFACHRHQLLGQADPHVAPLILRLWARMINPTGNLRHAFGRVMVVYAPVFSLMRMLTIGLPRERTGRAHGQQARACLQFRAFCGSKEAAQDRSI